MTSSSLSSSFLFTDRIQTPDSSSFAEQQSHPQSHHLITVPTTGCSISVSIFIRIFHSIQQIKVFDPPIVSEPPPPTNQASKSKRYHRSR
ncbi:hypothetical protein Hanom_Chr00s000005g01611551 [Helianthus anomalus]